MTESILNSIKSIITLSEDEKNGFLGILRHRKFKKKDYVFKNGDLCNFIIFVKSGIFRLFHLHDGEEKIIEFFIENYWYTDFESYLTNQSTHFSFQAMTDGELILLYKEDIEKMYDKFPRTERIGRRLVEMALVDITNKGRVFENISPEQRYLRLMENRPFLLDALPQYYIASYLNLKPESLSRIRKRLSKTF